MEREQVVFVRCRFSRGGFPSERVFIVAATDGGEWRGVAPVRYCYTRDYKPLTYEPPIGKMVDGFVVGVEIDRPSDEAIRVYLPDGNIYNLGVKQVTPVRVGDAKYVPVES